MDINTVNAIIALCGAISLFFIWTALFYEESGFLDKAERKEEWDVSTKVQDKNAAITGQIILPLAQKLIPYTQKYTSNEELEKIRTSLLAAGNPFNIKPIEFFNFRYSMAIIGSVIGFLAGVCITSSIITFLGVVVACSAGGYLLGPKMFLEGIMKERHSQLSQGLPNYLNLLSVCLRSGLDFVSSLKIINKYTDGLITKEMNIVTIGVSQGETLSEAMKTFNARCKGEGTDEFYQTIRSIEKYGQMGTVAVRINQLSSDIQEKMFNEVKKRAAAAESKIYIPAVIFLVALLIITGVPIGMSAIK